MEQLRSGCLWLALTGALFGMADIKDAAVIKDVTDVGNIIDMADTVDLIDLNNSVDLNKSVDMEDMEEVQKHSLKCDMRHLFEEDPEKAENINELFCKGIFYGRIRFNSFGFQWKEEIAFKGLQLRKNHAIAGLGGSLIYRSAYLHGFSVGAGIYTSGSQGSLNNDEAYLYKSGKGVMSRYDALTDGKVSLNSLAQAYLEYKNEYVSLKAGRQIFESFLTKSNDTKMIPNTFEGVTLTTPTLYHTSLKAAYLTRQKLRDHSNFHHVLAVGDDPNDPYDFFTQNDDTAMHYGLDLSELKARNIDDRLIVLEAKNRGIENLTLKVNYTAVPDLISSAMVQANYRMYLGHWSVIPALRYMQQFDNGAGEIGGANLKTLTDGYKDPDSLDAALYGARLDLLYDTLKLRFGYTNIADKGDLVAPWRGFPTGGFTRAMGQYNWNANTESFMFQLDYKFEKLSDFKIISRFAIQDFDDGKMGVQADSNVFTIDFLKGLGHAPVYVKTRFAHVYGDNDTVASNGFHKLDPSYDEIRFEINYLF